MSLLERINDHISRDFADEQARIESDLAPLEARKRLARAFGARSLLVTTEDHLVGSVSGDEFTASLHRAWSRNSFRPVLRATIDETDSGCVIRGEYSVAPSTVYIILLLAAVPLMMAAGVSMVLIVTGQPLYILAVLGGALLMMAALYVVIRLGVDVAKTDTRDLEAELAECLQARPEE